jgi:hypothetical protein
LKPNRNEDVIDVKLRLYPRFGNTWVHYDHELFRVDNGKSVGELRSGTDWGSGGATFPSWRAGNFTAKYITSVDKKQWRFEEYRFREFWDKELKVNDFDDKIIINSREFKIVDVDVENPPYVCPQTGVVWMPKRREKTTFSKRLWLFAIAPKETNNFWVINSDECKFYKTRYATSKTAFISGNVLRLIFDYEPDIKDQRAFLHEREEVSRFDVIKSAARHIKKISRVAPLSKSTRMFFQNLGALAHLMQSQKYAKSTT